MQNCPVSISGKLYFIYVLRITKNFSNSTRFNLYQSYVSILWIVNIKLYRFAPNNNPSLFAVSLKPIYRVSYLDYEFSGSGVYDNRTLLMDLG